MAQGGALSRPAPMLPVAPCISHEVRGVLF